MVSIVILHQDGTYTHAKEHLKTLFNNKSEMYQKYDAKCIWWIDESRGQFLVD